MTDATEFTRPISIDDVHVDGQSFRFEADEQERAALAARLGLISLEKFEVTALVSADHDAKTASADGTVSGTVVQACSVTLDPLTSDLTVPLALRFADDAEGSEPDSEEYDPDDEDPPEPLTGGVFDLGEAAVQLFSVEIDPFPRTPGSTFDGTVSDADGDQRENPFAVLQDLKDKLE